jgi:hypothetical protein
MVIACAGDVDGPTAPVIVARAVNALSDLSHLLPTRRGEHVHHALMKRRVRGLGPERLVVLVMVSRPQPIIPTVPTLVIDHHHAAAGVPPGAVVVNGYDCQPVATTSVERVALHFTPGVCEFRRRCKLLIAERREMSEWLKEHAWRLTPATRANAHQIRPKQFRSTT